MIKISPLICVFFCLSTNASIELANQTSQRVNVITMKQGIANSTSFPIEPGITATINYCPDLLLFLSQDRKSFGNVQPNCNGNYVISLDNDSSLNINEVRGNLASPESLSRPNN
jgi:hypothetical protein